MNTSISVYNLIIPYKLADGNRDLIPIRVGDGESSIYRLRSSQKFALDPQKRICVSSGITLSIPSVIDTAMTSEEKYSKLLLQANLCSDHEVYQEKGLYVVSPLVISSFFKGEIKIELWNIGTKTVNVAEGDPIAYLYFTFSPRTTLNIQMSFI